MAASATVLPDVVQTTSIAPERLAPSPALPVPEASAPSGQRLSLVPQRASVTPSDAAPVSNVAPASGSTSVAVLLRVQPLPGGRVNPRQDSSAAALAPIEPSEEGDFWHGTVGQLVAAEAVSAMARELALQSQLVARDSDQWLLRVERETLNAASSRDRLQAALATLGHEVRLVVEVGIVVDSPARRNAHAAAERQRVAEEVIHNDPLVQAMMRDYGAKIVPGSLRPE